MKQTARKRDTVTKPRSKGITEVCSVCSGSGAINGYKHPADSKVVGFVIVPCWKCGGSGKYPNPAIDAAIRASKSKK